jgi:hypothetical protein
MWAENCIAHVVPIKHSSAMSIKRLVIEIAAVALAGAFIAVVLITPASPDENTTFFIALIGALAVWEGVRFALLRWARS